MTPERQARWFDEEGSPVMYARSPMNQLVSDPITEQIRPVPLAAPVAVIAASGRQELPNILAQVRLQTGAHISCHFPLCLSISIADYTRRVCRTSFR